MADSRPPSAPATSAAPDAADETPLDCPACGYDLRGFADARCPECGSRFDIAQLRAGAARLNQTTWLDTADVWQPHQLFVRSLYELLAGAFQPNARLARVDVNGPAAAAVAMFLLGEFWISMLCAVPLAMGIALQTETSPTGAVRAAMIYWMPRLLFVRWTMYAFICWPAMDSRLLRVVGVTALGRFRVIAYWLPALGFWCSVPLAVFIAVTPDFALSLAWTAPILTGCLALFGIARVAGRRLRSIATFAVACGILSMCAGGFAASHLLPGSLMPPVWIFVW